MVEIMFHEIRPSSMSFKKVLSIRVLECVVTQDGVEIYSRRKFVYNESRNKALSVLWSYFNKMILKSPISIIVLFSFENFWSNSER